MSLHSVVKAVLFEALYDQDTIGEGDIAALTKKVVDVVKLHQKPVPLYSTTTTHKVGELSQTKTVHTYKDEPIITGHTGLDFETRSSVPLGDHIADLLQKGGPGSHASLDENLIIRVHTPSGERMSVKEFLKMPDAPVPDDHPWRRIMSLQIREYTGDWDRFLCWIGWRSNVVAHLEPRG